MKQRSRSIKEPKKQAHLYDETLKSWFGNEAPQIISHLLADATLQNEQNIEIDRTNLKADLVYLIDYKGEQAILNLELQTGPDPTLLQRLLQYHSGLHAKHQRPVINVVIYPFEMPVQEPPYVVAVAGEVCSVLNYKMVCLWELDAVPIVKNHVLCMYTLLPAMKGVKEDLIRQALQEMADHYPPQQLGHQLIRLYHIMDRAQTMSEQDKQIIEEVLFMQYHYDEFIDENRSVLKRIAIKTAEAAAEAAAKATAETTAKVTAQVEITRTQEMIVEFLNVRFPTLGDSAKKAVLATQNKYDLDHLARQLFVANDEQEVRRILKLSES